MFRSQRLKPKPVSEQDTWNSRHLLIELNNSINWRNYDWDKDVDEQTRNIFKQWWDFAVDNKIPEAIEKFKLANRKNESWSYPLYELGYLHMLSNQPEKALEYFKKAYVLEPKGFFSLITDLFVVEQIISSNLPVDAYKDYVDLHDEFIGTKKEEKCVKILNKYPNLGPLYKIYLECLVFNMKFDEAEIVFKEAEKFEMDIDSKMKIKIIKCLFYIMTWYPEKINNELEWISKENSSLETDNLASIINSYNNKL